MPTEESNFSIMKACEAGVVLSRSAHRPHSGTFLAVILEKKHYGKGKKEITY